jgi:uncharacterized membrane protein YdjX (TVP38/TMEM64 family)
LHSLIVVVDSSPLIPLELLMKKNWLAQHWKKLVIVALAFVTVYIGLKFLPLQDWLTHIKDWLTQLGVWAIPTFILIYILATVAGLPVVLLMLIAGTLFGLIEGTLSVSIADTLGAAACFFLGRTVGRERIKQWMVKRPQFTQLDKAVARKGWKIVLLSRLSPLLPSNILNYGFSLTKVNFWQYLFFTWLGMLPVIALYVYLGAFGGGLLSGGGNGKLVFQILGLLVTIGGVVYTTRLAKKTIAADADSQD